MKPVKTLAKASIVKNAVNYGADLLRSDHSLRRGFLERMEPDAMDIARVVAGVSLVGGGVLGAIRPQRNLLVLRLPTSPNSRSRLVNGYNRTRTQLANRPRIRRLLAFAEIVTGTVLAVSAFRAMAR